MPTTPIPAVDGAGPHACRRAVARLCPYFVALSLCAPVLSQEGARSPNEEEEARFATERAREREAARAIRHWVEEYSRGRIRPAQEVLLARRTTHAYIELGLRSGLLKTEGPKRTTHFTLLQRMVQAASAIRTRGMADSLLALSAAAYTRDMYAPTTVMIRDLGHFALMRSADPTTWQHLMSVATGDDVVDPEDLVQVVAIDSEEEAAREEEFVATARVMRRVAALRLLGMKGGRVAAVVIEKCLDAPDPRVRLAAIEALGGLRDLRFTREISRRAQTERDPLVVMAMIDALERTLKKHRDKVPISFGMNVTRDLLPLLGRRGWRNDMGILRLVRSYPVRPAIPALIHRMRAAQAEIDPLLKAVNDRASPVLADEIFQTLRQSTGALIGPDPNAWQAFWLREKDRLQLVAPYRKRRRGNTVSRGTFFGIPVVGREVVFVIDTSGSMKKVSGRGTVTGDNKKKRLPTRLELAVHQTQNAVQGVDPHTRFHLVSFSSGVRVWNQKPVAATRQNFSRLSESLGRLEAVGGTNIFAALMHALGGAQLRYGQRIKRGVDEVFLLSDGEPSVGEVTKPKEILRLVRELNRYQKIRIHTVFLGSKAGGQFMQQLAEENFGVFVMR